MDLECYTLYLDFSFLVQNWNAIILTITISIILLFFYIFDINFKGKQKFR